MNILFIAWNFPPKIGGMENIAYGIRSGLSKKYNIITLAPWSANPEGPGTDILRCPFKNLIAFNFWALYKGSRLLAKRSIDLVFSASFITSPVSIILSRFFKVRVMTQIYGLDIIYPNFLHQFICKIFLPLNDLVLAISNRTREEALKRGLKQDRARVIHPGIYSRDFDLGGKQQQLKSKYRLGNRKIILSVCRLAKRKGIVEFIDNSLPEVIKEIPDLTYVVVGDNPRQSIAHKEDIMFKIKEAVKKNGLENNVILFSDINPYKDFQRLVEIYNLCDIFLLPVIDVEGDMEGFGVVFLEASASGKPVIGTSIGGIPDAVEDGKSGFLIEPGDYAGLSRLLVSLLKDDEKRKRIGSYGKEMVARKFDWEAVIENYSGVIDGFFSSNTRWISTYYKTRRNEKLREKRIKILCSGLKRDIMLLDFGCGDGLNLNIFKKLGFLNLYGLDNCKDFLDKIDFIPKQNIFLADGSNTGFKDESFGLVFVDSVLHHLEHYDLVINEIKRILQPGGILCILEPRPSLARSIIDLLTFSPLRLCSKYIKFRYQNLKEEYPTYKKWLSEFEKRIGYIAGTGLKKLYSKKTSIGIILKYQKAD